MNPPPTSLPITSLWVIPMHQPQAALGHLRLSGTGNHNPETGPDWQSRVGCSGPLKDSILYERRAGVAFVKQKKTPHTWTSARPLVWQGWGHTAGS